MAKSQTTKRDEQRELTRRALIKWSVAAGAALGVSRQDLRDPREDGGKDVAYAAAELAPLARSTSSPATAASRGSRSCWPHPDIATAGNATLSWHLAGQQTVVAGTDEQLVIGPDTPWCELLAQRQMTAFLCGSNKTHTPNAQDRRGTSAPTSSRSRARCRRRLRR